MQEKNSSKNIVGVILTLAIIVVIGFFVYPNIGFLKGIIGGDEKGGLPPRNVQGVEMDGAISLSWDGPDSLEKVDSYLIEYIDIEKNKDTIDTGSDKTSYILTGLTNGVEYSVYIYAIVGGNMSDASDVAVFVPNGDGKGGGDDWDGEPGTPFAPSDISVIFDEDKKTVEVSWSVPFDRESGIDQYNVYYQEDKSDKFVKTEVDGKNQSISFSSDIFDKDLIYNFAVTASNSFGEGDFSEVISFDFSEGGGSGGGAKDGVPDAPENIFATAGDSQVNLVWDKPKNNGSTIIKYTVVYQSSKENEPNYKDIQSENKTSTAINDLNNDVEYGFAVTATNSFGESEMSDIVYATPRKQENGNGVEFSFSKEPTVTVSSSSALVHWETTKSSYSRVYFGATDDLGLVKEMQDSGLVKGHHVPLSNLAACTVYVYKVVSYYDEDNVLEGAKGDFITRGCKGDAEIISYDRKKATSQTGTVVEVKTNGRGLTASVPASVAGAFDVAIQVIKVEKNETISEISKPEGRIWIGQSYVLNAVKNEREEVKSFEKEVIVSIDYSNEDLNGVSPESLKIWHYEDEKGWRELESCSLVKNGSGGTVTCTTMSFSIFGLFGEGDAPDQGSGGGSENGSSPSTPPTTAPLRPSSTGGVTGGQYFPNPVTSINNPDSQNFKFTQNLWQGLKNIEVRFLQVFLNSIGFKVSEIGPGSPGQETDFFGVKTKEALIRFQEANKVQILTPVGLNFGTGFFGPQTRNFINSMQN